MLRILLSWATALLLSGCSAVPFISGEIRMTADELTQRMARRFPLEKSIAGLVDVTLVRARVELNADQQRISATLDISVKPALMNRTVSGVLKVSGQPEYIAESHSLFLRDARIEQIRMDNTPDALSAGLAKAASSFVRNALEDRPLYTFKPEDLTRYGVRYEPKRIEVSKDALVLRMR